jgi:pimeloyl-ACP methyl ester carboxylesterase
MSGNQVRYRHIRTAISENDRSFALLSIANPGDVKKALFFVHGFAGKATTTWADFLSLADDGLTSRWWEGADMFFYDYHRASIREQIHDNAVDLFHFLEKMFPAPPEGLFNRPEENLDLRPRGFCYDEMYLVGHSEGGLLARRAILMAAEKDQGLQAYRNRSVLTAPEPKGLLKADLRLFAPAIAGTLLTGIRGLIARSPVVEMGMAVVGAAAKQGMAPEAPPVTTARNETKEMADAVNMDCFRAHIVWADKDWVVYKEKYPKDRECMNSHRGTRHTTVCKPNEAYRLPLEFVEKGIGACV